jgi:hypothetical protein
MKIILIILIVVFLLIGCYTFVVDLLIYYRKKKTGKDIKHWKEKDDNSI